jgi:hypothetical protein
MELPCTVHLIVLYQQHPCLFVRRISIPRRICSLNHIFPGSSDDSNILTAGKDGDNDASLNQKTFNTQRNGQNKVDDDDYYLRGAVSSTPEGKQVQEKNLIHLCGASFEKRTDFIREYFLPSPCSQPVGITVQQQQEVNGSDITKLG